MWYMSTLQLIGIVYLVGLISNIWFVIGINKQTDVKVTGKDLAILIFTCATWPISFIILTLFKVGQKS